MSVVSKDLLDALPKDIVSFTLKNQLELKGKKNPVIKSYFIKIKSNLCL